MTSRPVAAEPQSPSIGAFVRAPAGGEPFAFSTTKRPSDSLSPCSVLRSAVPLGDAACSRKCATTTQSQKTICTASDAECTARGSFLVEKQGIGVPVSPTKVGCVVQKLRDVRLMLSLAEVGWSSTKAPETRERRRLGARPLVGVRSLGSGHCHGSSTTRPGGCGASSSTRGRARPSRSLCAPTGLALASVVTTRPGVGGGRVTAVGRIPPHELPSTLKVASGGLGKRSPKPILGISEAI
jgi:hypothetical protein